MSRHDEHRAIRDAAAIGALAPLRQLGVAGADRASYLHGLLTNDVQRLTPGAACYAAWLTPQGRMLTDMDVLETGDSILLDVPAEQADATLQRLDQYVFSEDVRVESLDGRIAGAWIHGPRAAVILQSSLTGLSGTDDWADYTLRKGAFDGAPLIVARMDRLGVPGFCAYLDPALAAPLKDALERAGAVTVGAEAIEAARIEAGYPLYGVDMDADTIPLEAGIEDRAISFTKGCYVGQEVIIRVLHRGGGRVAKKLVGLQLDGPPVPRRTRIVSGDRDIGFVTSIAESPEAGTIALGYVHRDFVEPGTSVRMRSEAGDVPATVTARRIRGTAATD